MILSAAFGISGVACLTSMVVTLQNITWLIDYTMWLALVGKMGSTVAYQGKTVLSSTPYYIVFYLVVFLCAAELFPTPIRSQATSLGMVFGTIGGFLSPFLSAISPIWISYALFG